MTAPPIEPKPEKPALQRLRTVLPHVWELVAPRRWMLALGLVLIAINRVAGLVLPASTKVLIDDVVGARRADLLRAQGRHNMRPAHLHFLTSKDGFKTLISQIYVQDDKFIDSDVQFGVTRKLIGNYVRHENEPAPAADVKGPWYSLDYTFTMEKGTTKLPRAPISGKAKGERPKIPHLA